jgi:molybdopterin molybdotransferase
VALRKGSYALVGEAIGSVLAAVRPVSETQKVDAGSSIGRVLAKDLVAGSDSPPFPISHMDGFAVIASDLVGAMSSRPVKLEVGAEEQSGRPLRGISPGEAARVSTGTRLPEGADAVVPVEEVSERGRSILLTSEARTGDFVYPTGADFRNGELLLGKNRTIRAQDVGLLLTLGLAKVEVFRRPTVAVLATGNELSNRIRPPAGKVRNSHGPVFRGMVRALGGVPLDMGIGRDDVGVLTERITGALSKADMVLTMGGTSAGRRDLIGEVVKKLGPEVMFHGLRMDRGRVAGVAVLDHKPLVMLPGPIQGAMNAFNLLGAPILDRLRGGGRSVIRVGARLSAPWQARPLFQRFAKVIYVRLSEDRPPGAEPLAGDTESVTVLTKADGYVVVPEKVTSLREGDPVEVNLLPGFSFAR